MPKFQLSRRQSVLVGVVLIAAGLYPLAFGIGLVEQRSGFAPPWVGFMMMTSFVLACVLLLTGSLRRFVLPVAGTLLIGLFINGAGLYADGFDDGSGQRQSPHTPMWFSVWGSIGAFLVLAGVSCLLPHAHGNARALVSVMLQATVLLPFNLIAFGTDGRRFGSSPGDSVFGLIALAADAYLLWAWYRWFRGFRTDKPLEAEPHTIRQKKP